MRIWIITLAVLFCGAATCEVQARPVVIAPSFRNSGKHNGTPHKTTIAERVLFFTSAMCCLAPFWVKQNTKYQEKLTLRIMLLGAAQAVIGFALFGGGVFFP